MSILVYIENRNGKLPKSAFELISYAARIAKDKNTAVTALSIGTVDTAELSKVGNYGASKVLNVADSRLEILDNSAYTAVIEQAVQQENAEIIVLGSGFTGKAIAPRLSARLKAGLVPFAVSVPASYSPLIIRKKTFTGKLFSNVEVTTSRCVITLSPNSFGLNEQPVNAEIVGFSPVLPESVFTTKVESTEKFSGKVLLTEADIVVSGGRGMKGPENWEPIEELAGLLGAATACSRPVADEGWRPHTEHVGQTGKVIAPNLYFALGISGAIQHVGGVSSSKVIVAVNKDPEAPIFTVADYGIVGDVQKIVPQVVAAVRELKSH
jgi:electron transfer flavoprotein alpha subunit